MHLDDTDLEVIIRDFLSLFVTCNRHKHVEEPLNRTLVTFQT